MKRKQLLALLLALTLTISLLSACSGGKTFTSLQANENGTVTIQTQEITSTAKFFNYDADGVTVQLVALRDSSNGVHLAFNTCQSCSPSPKAYYRQSGNVLQCENCGFTFAPEQIGIVHGGCNPWPIDGVSVDEGCIVIPVTKLEAMLPQFTSWGGPTK